MNETLFLDFLIGLLLFISLWIFYESTIIFYVMMHIHIILVTFLIGIIFNFRETIRELLINPLSLVGYIVPFTIEILFSIIFVYVRFIVNKLITLQDIIIVSITPLMIVSLPFIFSNLQQFVSPDAKYNIYKNFNILGLLSNTVILFSGCTFGLFIVNQLNH